jgi:hypothetical protein
VGTLVQHCPARLGVTLIASIFFVLVTQRSR